MSDEKVGKSQNTKKLPKWMTSHFRQSLDAHKNLTQIIRLSEKGISGLRGMPQIVKVLADLDERSDDEEYQNKIRIAEEEASLAQAEIDKDFPVLHQFAVVALWSWLEHFVKDFVALWLQHRREAITLPPLSKIKIRLGEYVQLSKAEQSGYLVELLEQELASPLKRGVTRFEILLEPFLPSSQLPEGCSQAIFELQQVRNVMAHRNGLMDRRLKSACPWLKGRLGQPVKVTGNMLHRYSEACGQYLLEVLYRVGDAHDIDLRGKRIDEPGLTNQALKDSEEKGAKDA